MMQILASRVAIALSMMMGCTLAQALESKAFDTDPQTSDPQTSAQLDQVNTASANPSPTHMAQASVDSAGQALYQHLGRAAGIETFVASFIKLILADQRIAATFDGVDQKRLHTKLVEQFCLLSGGPCVYTGGDMAEVHQGLKINQAQFNALVEDLQLAMQQSGIASRYQNQLLSKLAPMQRVIVTR